MKPITYIEAITLALREEMRRDDRVCMLGEDIGPYGGVFKATMGLHAEFGDMRVLDSPLSESLIVGASIGAAMAGLRPVPRSSSPISSPARSIRSWSRRRACSIAPAVTCRSR